MKYLKHAMLAGALTVMFAVPALAAEAQPPANWKDFRVLHHERLSTPRFVAPTTTPNAATSAEATTMSFDAFGRHFDLELEPNDELLMNLPTTQKRRLRQSVRIYKGRIAGIAGSWTRISRSADRVTGAFYDGQELYIIDTSDRISRALDQGGAARLSGQPYSLIYRLSDTQSDETCAVDPDARPLRDYSGMVDELKAFAEALPAASRQLDLAIVADSQFTQANSANPQAAVVDRMNVVDGIYSEQVGVHLHIAEIRALASNGSLASTSAGTLLDQFAAFTRATGFTNPGLSHLFTGRDLDGSTVGIAFIGVLCRTDVGVGVSQTNGTGTAGALTVAHEIGHNFGAPHDNQSGSACASTAGTFIMNPFITGATQFSACSLQQMAPHIANAACLSDTPTTAVADVRPVLPVNPIVTRVATNFAYRVEVRNSGTAAAQGTTARITIPTSLTVQSVTATAGSCTNSAGTVNCTLGTLAGNGVNTITVNLRSGATPINLTSAVQVAATNDSNAGNNAASATINVLANATTILNENFNAGLGGFVYADDAFRGTAQPAYALGRRLVSSTGNGYLQILVGGVDDAAVLNMSGAYRRTFSLPASARITLSFDYSLAQAASYESDEFSDALLSVDGRLIGVNGGEFLSRLTGDGNGGAVKTSTTLHRDIDLGVLSAGNHTIAIGAYNNKKTLRDESSHVLLDNVRVTASP